MPMYRKFWSGTNPEGSEYVDPWDRKFIPPDNMTVIPISGHAGSGKDTVARLMAHKLRADGHTVLITHYADLLKYICSTFLGWDGKKDEAGRELLQYVGTDLIRERDPNYWVQFIMFMLDTFRSRWEYVLIPDTRFVNEVDYFKWAGFNTVHLRIVRKDFQSALTTKEQNHASETSLDYILPDYCILNANGLKELRADVIKFVEDYLYGDKT